MKRKHKTYSRPKRPFEKARIEEEAKIKEEFGLKNKKEIWKADARIKSIREKAKKLISSDEDEKNAFFDRIRKIGLKVSSISDVLSLDKKDYLRRRLQTILVEKKIARTPKGARQLITHKKVFIGGKLVSSPSYIVPVEFEKEISLKPSKVKQKKEEVIGGANE
ncbi:MAG: 30S ribosomal protein S4 [Candidatus Nanoarchaeia archaeon]|nr:30S ribosomal protein S4 [Candidatus Nanoarchaeia archaeon]MDD5358083.1 30S ribosomal protein S4 [Candidatus Nanoarchaeia archaeon]MDD5589271.1 30S ribosomal protein S4 [Candidatus Nanoarchaeia archaeon]